MWTIVPERRSWEKGQELFDPGRQPGQGALVAVRYASALGLVGLTFKRSARRAARSGSPRWSVVSVNAVRFENHISQVCLMVPVPPSIPRLARIASSPSRVPTSKSLYRLPCRH